MLFTKAADLNEYKILGALRALGSGTLEDICRFSGLDQVQAQKALSQLDDFYRISGAEKAKPRFHFLRSKEQTAEAKLKEMFLTLPVPLLSRRPDPPLSLLVAEQELYHNLQRTQISRRADELKIASLLIESAESDCEILFREAARFPHIIEILRFRLKALKHYHTAASQNLPKAIEFHQLLHRTDVSREELDQLAQDGMTRVHLAYLRSSVELRERTGQAKSARQLMDEDWKRVQESKYPTEDCLQPYELANFTESTILSEQAQEHLRTCDPCWALAASLYELRNKTSALPAIFTQIRP